MSATCCLIQRAGKIIVRLAANKSFLLRAKRAPRTEGEALASLMGRKMRRRRRRRRSRMGGKREQQVPGGSCGSHVVGGMIIQLLSSGAITSLALPLFPLPPIACRLSLFAFRLRPSIRLRNLAEFRNDQPDRLACFVGLRKNCNLPRRVCRRETGYSAEPFAIGSQNVAPTCAYVRLLFTSGNPQLGKGNPGKSSLCLTFGWLAGWSNNTALV